MLLLRPNWNGRGSSGPIYASFVEDRGMVAKVIAEERLFPVFAVQEI